MHTLKKWVKPEDLNQHGRLFGGRLIEWIDQEAAIIAIYQTGNRRIVTKYFSEIEYLAQAKQGDMLELNFRVNSFGRTSITLSCQVQNVFTGEVIVTVSQMVFVCLGEDGRPEPHGFSTVISDQSRLGTSH